MAGEWTAHRLENLCSLITDGKHGDCEDQPNSGFFFLSVKDVVGDRLRYDGARQISKADFAETHRRTNLEPGDVLFTNTGTIGRMAIAPDDPKTYRTTFQKSVAILKPRRSIIDSSFLYYALRFKGPGLSELAAGTTQVNLLLKDIRTFSIKVPSLPVQRDTVRILAVLDDKIELNRRMNETLEAMARAVFKDWFVNFGPTRAKMERRESYISRDLWALFPDDLDRAEKPKGWKAGHLSDVAVSSGQVVSPETLAPSTPYIGLEHMPRRCIALDNWNQAGKVTSTKLTFRRGDFLFGKLRPYFHKVGIAPLDGICSTDIVVVRAKAASNAAFVLACISLDEFVAYTDQTSGGTKMPRTSWEQMARYSLALPADRLMMAFQDFAAPLFERIVSNIYESRTIAATRDLLLPKLMSGEIRLKDAERIAEAAA